MRSHAPRSSYRHLIGTGLSFKNTPPHLDSCSPHSIVKGQHKRPYRSSRRPTTPSRPVRNTYPIVFVLLFGILLGLKCSDLVGFAAYFALITQWSTSGKAGIGSSKPYSKMGSRKSVSVYAFLAITAHSPVTPFAPRPALRGTHSGGNPA
jgi:hypothetical protein